MGAASSKIPLDTAAALREEQEATLRKLEAARVLAATRREEEETARIRAATRREEEETARIRAATQRELGATRREDAASRREEEQGSMKLAVMKMALIAGTAMTICLAADWVVHSFPPYMRWNMRRRLVSGGMLRRAVAASKPLLPGPQVSAPATFLPLMLYGPSGCGKSSSLSQLARNLASSYPPTPVALVRFRLPDNKRRRSAQVLPPSSSQAPSGGSQAVSAAELKLVAADVCKQVGYPSRDPVLATLPRTLRLRFGSAEVEWTKEAAEARDRASAALTMLFEVAADVSRAGSRDYVNKRAPVLMFDEVHDLIRNDQFRIFGGQDVFFLLGSSFLTYGTDEQRIRIIASGSSYEFAAELRRQTPLGSTRTNSFLLEDPTPAVMLQALQDQGYTAAEAAEMVQLCGTRLRLFDEALQAGARKLSHAVFLQKHRHRSSVDIDELFARMATPEAQLDLSALLDAILKADEDTRAPRPKASHLPAAVAAVPHSAVLFSTDLTLHFQSVLIRNEWKRRRAGELSHLPTSLE